MATTRMPALAQTSAGALPSLAAGHSLGNALGIPTVPNLRDVGGYKIRDGATARRGLAYCSDTFNPMSADRSHGEGRPVSTFRRQRPVSNKAEATCHLMHR
jgi:protein-tyrosine phosphatase family protein